MSHSNSSLNCFANCMAKYENNYILHTPPCKPISPHLTFGVMAHEVLHKAGILRDEVQDGVVDKEQYNSVIPSEVLYSELKTEFNIKSWNQYFTPIIKATAEYEQYCIDELRTFTDEPIHVERELKLQLTVDQLNKIGITGISQPIVGIIDLLIYTDNFAIILDYKFSSNRKNQNDFDMNSQLPLYAFLVTHTYNIPIYNIQYGYIDIPKQSFGMPLVLSNGTLSRSKSQNVSQDLYKQAVIAVHGDDPYYNCDEGGYYYNCYCELACNKPAYLSKQWADVGVCDGVIKDLINAAKMIDFMIEHKMPFLKKYDSYSCGSCEYLNACKYWLNVNGEM